MTVSGCVHETPTELLDLAPGHVVESVEDLLPVTVAYLCGVFGRAHDVGEKNGRQDPIRFGKSAVAMPGDEFLNVADQPLARSSKAGVGKIVVFDVFCVRDSGGEFSTFSDRNARVGAMNAGTDLS